MKKKKRSRRKKKKRKNKKRKKKNRKKKINFMEATVYDLWQGLGQKTLNNYLNFMVHFNKSTFFTVTIQVRNVCAFPKYSLTSEDSEV